MRIVVTDQSNVALVNMFADSIERTKNHHKFNKPDVVVR